VHRCFVAVLMHKATTKQNGWRIIKWSTGMFLYYHQPVKISKKLHFF